MGSFPKQRLWVAIALSLVVLAASGGMAARFYLPGMAGQRLFVGTRILLWGLPLGWVLWVDRGSLRRTWPSLEEIKGGLGLGLWMAGVIAIAYWGVGRTWLDKAAVQAAVAPLGLTQPLAYLSFGLYFTLINAFIEEYVWRWFVYQKCAVLFGYQGAVYGAAWCFTLHHVVALVGYTNNALITVVGSVGVFLAGVIWSWCFRRYQSLWACYLSHGCADGAIALIGWDLLFWP